MKIFYTFLALTFIFLGNSSRLAIADNPRLRIQIFRYGGSEHGDTAKAYDQFYKIIKDKMNNLHLELGEKIKKKENYLKKLSVSEPLKDTIPNAENLHIHWNDQKALEVLRGNILPESGANYYLAQSSIYLGDLGEECECLSKPSVYVKLPITEHELGKTLDSHSLVTFIALALDSIKVDECNTYLTADLLAIAKDKFIKIKGTLTIDNIDLFESAIENIEKYIKSTKTKKHQKCKGLSNE